MSRKTSFVVLFSLLIANLTLWSPLLSARQASEFDHVDLLVNAYHEITSMYVEKPDGDKLSEAAVRAMLKTLDDPHSSYFNEEEIKGFNKNVHGEFSGIGAEVEIHNNMLRIVSPLQDSPAWNAGVQAGDIVLTVDGDSTKGLSISECIQRLTGKSGTKVTIRVKHLSGEEKDITITRARIVVQTVQGWRREADSRWDFMLDDKNKVGYVRLSQFTAATPKALFEALDDLQNKGVKGLIIDVRFNPGGLLGAAAQISNKFLKRGDVIVSTKGRTVPERMIRANGEQAFPADIPIVIITNEASASASEILAGALGDNGRAKIVGTRTFGKGSVQQVKKLEAGGAIKLTNAYYYLPKGENIHRKPKADKWGVDPDDGYYVPMTGKEMQEMVTARRESTGPNSKLKDIKQVTVKWLNDDMKDPQLAAALDTMIAKVKDGDWKKVGKSGADDLARLGRLETLERQREFLTESLDKVEQEITRLRAGGDLEAKKDGDPAAGDASAKKDDAGNDADKKNAVKAE